MYSFCNTSSAQLVKPLPKRHLYSRCVYYPLFKGMRLVLKEESYCQMPVIDEITKVTEKGTDQSLNSLKEL